MKTVLLGEIGRVVTGKTPPKANPEFWGDEIDFITPTDFQKDSRFIKPARKLSREGSTIMNNLLCPENSVMVTCIGSDMGKAAITKAQVITNQQINTLIIDQENFDPEFIYYLLKMSRPLLRKYAESGGSTMPIINKSTFEKLQFTIPEKVVQQKISQILGKIDEKIEMNWRMNETLEQVGRTLFRHSFIDNIESGAWPKEKIGSICDVILGGTPSRRSPENWVDGTVGWINSGKVNEFRIISPSEMITKEALEKSAAKILPAGTTVLAITGATLGQVSRLERSFAANQSVIGILGHKEIPNDFIYFWVKHNIENIISHQTGGAQQHINRDNIVNLEFLLPPQKLLHEFQSDIRPAMQRIAINCFEIENLIHLRDSLMPRLISGKVKV